MIHLSDLKSIYTFTFAYSKYKIRKSDYARKSCRILSIIGHDIVIDYSGFIHRFHFYIHILFKTYLKATQDVVMICSQAIYDLFIDFMFCS